MASSFFSKLFGKKVDLESIRAEIRRIERELRESFEMEAFRNGDWFLQNLQDFVQRYGNWDRIRELESTHPALSEDCLADLLIEELHVKGVAVVIEATHTCMTIRGVRKPGCVCVTSAMKGCFRTKPSTRAEVMALMYGDRR